MNTIYVTAGVLRAVLVLIDPENTPKIAYNRDDLALPLINHLKKTIGDKDGTQIVELSFKDTPEGLEQQFYGVCKNMAMIFEQFGDKFNG